MPSIIINRYDQTEVINEFCEVTHNYLFSNNRIPRQRVLLTRVLIAILIVLGIYLNQRYKQQIFQIRGMALILFIFYTTLVIAYYSLEIKNGILVGEYYHNGSIQVYQLTYVPQTNRCSVVQKKDGQRREIQFKYNEYVDKAGNLLQKEYTKFLGKFVMREELTDQQYN